MTKLVLLAVLVTALAVPVLAHADGAGSLDGSQMAWLPSNAPVLTSGAREVLGASEEGKGGCVPALASCFVPGAPLGQFENSGNEIPMGRAIIGWIPVIGNLYNAYKSYGGETMEGYLGVDSMASGGESKGGISAAWKSCCFYMPSGDLLNSDQTIPLRSWLLMVPYVGEAVGIYNVYKAYTGETAEEYLGAEF
jgi:hypothetical protein